MKPDYIRSFPGKYRLEIKTFEADDPSYRVVLPDGRVGPGGFSITIFKQQFAGTEGELTGPYGEKYRVSLEPWLEADPDKTLLYIQYSVTPDYPFYIDPALRNFPSKLPPVSSELVDLPATRDQPLKVEAAPVSPNAEPPKKINRRIHYTGNYPAFIQCSDMRKEHRLLIRPARPGKGHPASELLALPSANLTRITCPVCDASVNIFEPLENRINDMASELEQGEASLLEIIMDHPTDLAETKTPPDYLEVERYHRYFPNSEPPMPDLVDAERRIELKSHDHWLRIRPGLAGETGCRTAAEWLNSEWVRRGEFGCPLCETVLQTSEPLKELVEVLADLEGKDKTFEWSISHPLDTTPTGQLLPDFPFKVSSYPKDNERRTLEDILVLRWWLSIDNSQEIPRFNRILSTEVLEVV